jgi:predicted metal-binding membrane protein
MFYLRRVASALESALKRDRLIVAASLGLIAALSWAVTARLALDMSWMALGTSGWTAGYFTAMFLMWVVMMVAMMVPSAAPTILLYAALQRDARLRGTALFTAGYLAAWTAFSLAATIAQWGLAALGQLASPMMIRATPWLGAALLFAAGAYQLTPWKHACLGKCRSPAAFLVGRWKPGGSGAFLMGIEHGAYCAGCCWALMALLFVAGAMNLLWVAALAVFVLAEKLFPAGVLIARASALLMVAAGAYLVWGG